MADKGGAYYDDLWFIVEDDGEEDRYYSTKAAVTRRLRVRGLRFKR